MRIVTSISELRLVLAEHRRERVSVGFVPTMGFLHEGHLSLVSKATAENDLTVVSIFVNPLQFGEAEDLGSYPRNLERDIALLETIGPDILFAPAPDEMFPRPMATVVDVPELGNLLEGAVRPGHFAGVATVVTKLFNIVQPQRAYFGEKDYQQVRLIRRMVEDLALPVAIVSLPTFRETDGLACSSRNSYLDSEERRAAVVVPRALELAERLINDGVSDAVSLQQSIIDFIKSQPGAVPEVVAVCDPETLEPVALLSRPVLLLLFVRIGETRLLDNRVICTKTQAEAA